MLPLGDLAEVRSATSALFGALLPAAQREAEHVTAAAATNTSAIAPAPALPALQALLERYLVRWLRAAALQGTPHHREDAGRG